MSSEIEKVSFANKLRALDLISYVESLIDYKEKFANAVELKSKISIFLDTNVLLRYYSASFSNRQGLYEFFNEHKTEIILPYQVQKEFVKNREDIIDRFFNETLKALENSYKESVINPIQKYFDDNKKLFDDLPVFSEQLGKIKDESFSLHSTLEKEIQELKKKLQSIKSDDALLTIVQEMKLINSLTEEDKKYLKNEFDSLKKNIDISKALEEGRKPQAAFPGLGDIKKKPNDPYGDYFLFHEMLIHIKESKKDALFLTYDSTKNDWLKENKEPHSHYVQIIYLATGQNLFIVDADRFFDKNLKKHFNSLVPRLEDYSTTSINEDFHLQGSFALDRAMNTIYEFVTASNATTGKFVITTRANGEFQFNLKAGNGQTILSSEGYSSKSACEKGIELVRKNSQDDARFERKESSTGKPYFNLKAGNGQIIGGSEMYESATARDNGIASVKANAPKAVLYDKTG